ncbi:alpha/beta hydrolase [Simiduia curdlanivorans]|uniref:Alpha/beta hydrolase n=1 Tax=Simiduia curdlanivorans TaxID=1492769 RepID=A0ABV8V157_9GAMM|nr:alpha/beta hydrolase [Simiduia curdlanivorans]MDN3637561.1 alpha/beta hydrolase [Simiduia curdlanivorans]
MYSISRRLLLLVLALLTMHAGAEYSVQSTLAKIQARFPQAAPYAPHQGNVQKSCWNYSQNHSHNHNHSHQLAMDVYRLPDQLPRPAILLVHGGGWNSGERTLWQPIAYALANRGYVAITVSYRLSPQAPYPAARDDLITALEFMQARAAELGINTRALFIAGGSAGGQLASLVGLQWPVQGIINVDGLSDFTTPLALAFENDPAREVTAASAWLGGRYEAIPEIWRQASPINAVNKHAPPMLFITSGEARFSAGVEAMQDKLTALGVVNRRHEFKQAPHSFWLFEPWASATVAVIEQFLQARLSALAEPVPPDER